MARKTISYTAFVAKLTADIAARRRDFARDYGTPGHAPIYGGDYYTGINDRDRALCPDLAGIKAFTFRDMSAPVLAPALVGL